MKPPIDQPTSWKQAQERHRPTFDPKDDIAIDPTPATRDANETRRMQRTPGATSVGFAKGGKVKATGKAKVHRGEHVVRKAAAKKYGPRKMAAVNKGTAKVSVPKRK